MSFFKVFMGALVVGGGAALWYFSKRKPLSFDSYCDKCVEVGQKQISPDAIKTAIVLTQSDDAKYAIPYLYSRYADNTVKKKPVLVSHYPIEQCPDEVRIAIQKNEYIIKTINKA